MKNASIFSFFSGAGFLDLGFETSEFQVCFVNEIKESFLEAYKYSREKMDINHPIYGYSNTSIEKYLSGEDNNFLKKCIKNEKSKNKLVGFIGGPPCPDSSVGGKNRGRHGDNGRLSGIYAELICSLKPDFFLFENVKGLWRTKRHREFYDELKATLHKSNYITSDNLVNSIEYGVPQNRERIILFGIKKSIVKNQKSIDNFNWNYKVLYEKEKVLSLQWPVKNKFQAPIIFNKELPYSLTVDYWFEKNTVENHPNARDQFKPKAGLEKFLRIAEGDDSKKSYKRLHRFRYSPTVCYGNNEVHLHPLLPRRISVAESLALQSLPRQFELPPDMSLTDKFKTIGNGVPYLLAKGIADTIYNFLHNHVGS